MQKTIVTGVKLEHDRLCHRCHKPEACNEVKIKNVRVPVVTGNGGVAQTGQGVLKGKEIS